MADKYQCKVFVCENQSILCVCEPVNYVLQTSQFCVKTNIKRLRLSVKIPDCVAQSVMCLTADPGVASSIRTQSHTFVDFIGIISTAILLPSAYSRRVVVSYKGKNVHKVLVNRLVKLAQEKSVAR